MIVFNLKCPDDHVFEGWFGSSDDYAAQRHRGLIACPVCGSATIDKALTAPAIPAKSNRRAAPAPAPGGGPATAPPEMLRALAEAQAKLLESSQWVGRDFAERARAMHYGEEGHAAIHGEVAPAEARELIEEGVKVAPLPLPVVPPEAQN